MSATNHTPHANLPQFLATDIPTFSVDINDAFSAIDSAIYAAKQDSASATNEAQRAVETSQQNATDITELSVLTDAHDDSIGTLNGGQQTLRDKITNAELKNEAQDKRISSLEVNIGTDIAKLTADNGELFQFAYRNSQYGYLAKVDNVITFIAFA